MHGRFSIIGGTCPNCLPQSLRLCRHSAWRRATLIFSPESQIYFLVGGGQSQTGWGAKSGFAPPLIPTWPWNRIVGVIETRSSARWCCSAVILTYLCILYRTTVQDCSFKLSSDVQQYPSPHMLTRWVGGLRPLEGVCINYSIMQLVESCRLLHFRNYLRFDLGHHRG